MLEDCSLNISVGDCALHNGDVKLSMHTKFPLHNTNIKYYGSKPCQNRTDRDLFMVINGAHCELRIPFFEFYHLLHSKNCIGPWLVTNSYNMKRVTLIFLMSSTV